MYTRKVFAAAYDTHIGRMCQTSDRKWKWIVVAGVCSSRGSRPTRGKGKCAKITNWSMVKLCTEISLLNSHDCNSTSEYCLSFMHDGSFSALYDNIIAALLHTRWRRDRESCRNFAVSFEQTMGRFALLEKLLSGYWQMKILRKRREDKTTWIRKTI